MEYSFSYSELFVAILLIITSGLGFIIKDQKEKLKSIKSQLSEKKYKLYYDIYSLFFDLIKEEKSQKNKKNYSLETKIIDLKKDLLIYAPDSVAEKFIEWNRYISNNEGDMKHAKIFLELYILIRKDMGHPKTKIDELGILKLIMTTDKEVELMKQLIEL